MTSLLPTTTCRPAVLPTGRGRLGLWLAVVIWLGVIVGGFAQLLRYESTTDTLDGEPRVVGPLLFPRTPQLERNPTGQTLLMFAHPHCACTRASLNELAAILAECPDLQPARIIFPLPVNAPPSWQSGEIAQEAAALHGVNVIWDDQEQLTRLFDARTSGQVLLYDAAGQRLFSGGITALRGHAGWNAGRGAIVALHRQEASAHGELEIRNCTPVFGCRLLSDSVLPGVTP
jgi:hypothetical protein